MTRLSLSVVIILLCLPACKQRNRAESDVKYGDDPSVMSRKHPLDFGIGTASAFLRLQPNSKVQICGAGHAEIKKVFQDWATAVDRQDHLHVTSQRTCPTSLEDEVPANIPHGMVRAILPSEIESFLPDYVVEAAKQHCNQKALAMAIAGIHMEGAPEIGMDLVYCDADKTSWGVLYHEIGHGWGMCDQYTFADVNGTKSVVLGMHPTCGKLFRSEKATDSVMNSYYEGKKTTGLHSDDILGLRIQACRNDVGADNIFGPASQNINKKWAALLKDKISSWPGVAQEVIRINKEAGRDLFIGPCHDWDLEPWDDEAPDGA